MAIRNYRTEILRPYQGNVLADTPELLGHWHKFKRDGAPESLQSIAVNYLPNARLMALRLMRVNHSLFRDLAETLSIVTLALYECIDSFQPEKSHDSIAGFRPYFWEWGQKKSKRIARYDSRQGKIAPLSRAISNRIRDELTTALGRNPTPQEIVKAFGGKICDPQFYARPIPQTIHASSAVERDGGDPVDVLGNIPGREPAPDQAILEKEAKRELKRAMKGLDKREKAIVRQIMADEPLSHLSDEMNLSRQRVDQIAKRMLKRLRMQPNVADYFAAPSDLKAAA